MAAERSRRHNAGNKMSRLLEVEDEDDFYKTTYGGFIEVNVHAIEWKQRNNKLQISNTI